MNKVVHVAVGVMYGHDGQILIAKRPANVHQGGKLEFPGGKVEQGETVQSALVREFKEELGVQIDECSVQPLICLTHHYADKSVKLDVWEIHQYSGVPFGKEGQAIQWLGVDQLEPGQFPEANLPIISALRLPKTLMVTPDLSMEEALSDLPEKIQSSNALQCIVRLPRLSLSEYKTVWAHLISQPLNTTLIVHQHMALAVSINAPLHLRSAQLAQIQKEQLQGVRRLSASVHSTQEQQMAEHLGVEFTVFGAVKTTPTHQGEQGMGWEALSKVTACATVPVYAMGGMMVNDVKIARDFGAQGVAGIRLFKCM